MPVYTILPVRAVFDMPLRCLYLIVFSIIFQAISSSGDCLHSKISQNHQLNAPRSIIRLRSRWQGPYLLLFFDFGRDMFDVDAGKWHRFINYY